MATDKKLNADFDLDGLEGAEVEKTPVKKTASAKKPAKKAATAKETAPVVEPEIPVKKSHKVRIMIDEVRGMSNYETIGHNGDIIQVKRGIPVEVDEKFVHILELATQTDVIQSEDRVTGENIETERNFSSIPWRRV